MFEVRLPPDLQCTAQLTGGGVGTTADILQYGLSARQIMAEGTSGEDGASCVNWKQNIQDQKDEVINNY